MRKKRRVSKTLPTSPIIYPDGVVVKTPKGYFLLKTVKGIKKRYHLPTRRILDSWNFPRVVETSEAAVANYSIVAKLGFRDGTLIYNLGDGKIYLVSDNVRRTVKSPDALERIGCDLNSPVLVSEYEATLQRLGEDLL